MLTGVIPVLFCNICIFQSETFAQTRCESSIRANGAAHEFELKRLPREDYYKQRAVIRPEELMTHLERTLPKTEELGFIRSVASKMGVRVWMFGGTAASYLHYVKWDMARMKGLLKLQADRFDYDFTNIFRMTQDLDLVIDGTAEQVQQFQSLIAQKFPYLIGSKKAWEVRSLRFPIGKPGDGLYKEALLNDLNFSNQNTDSNSLAMVEITQSNEPVVRDLRAWTEGGNRFLDDSLANQITYFRNPKHFETARAKLGQNPEILSALRLLVKAFQYDLEFNPKTEPDLKAVLDDFDPKSITDATAIRRINETATKLVMHASNIEYAFNTLDQLGLRQKLLSMNLKAEGVYDASYWLKKEPLRGYTKDQLPKYASEKLKEYNFQPTGKTAKDLGIDIVAHETRNMLAHESMTRSHTGAPNVLISRDGYDGESAACGDGFYTRVGREGAVGSGLTIRFKVDPAAQEGRDFIKHQDFIIFLNKKSLTVIQESLNFGLVELVETLESGAIKLDHSDKAVMEKFKRRLNQQRIEAELDKLLNSPKKEDLEKLVKVIGVIMDNELFNDSTKVPLVKKIIELNESGRTNIKIQNDAIFWDYSKDLETFKKVIKYVHDINAKDVNGRTLLHLSARNGNKEIFDYLVRQPGVNLSAKDVWGYSVLFLVLTGNHREALKSLVAQPGVDLNEKDKNSKPLLHWAVSKLDSETLAIFLRQPGVDLNAKDGLGNTAVHLVAALRDSKENLEVLLEQGGVDLKAKDITGQSVLHTAVFWGNIEALERLVRHPGVDLNAKDNFGKTALHRAAERGNKEVLEFLIKQPGVDLKARDNKGGTILHWGAVGGQIENLKVLTLQPWVDLKAKDYEGGTVLHWASSIYRGEEALRHLINQPGLNLNAKDNNGRTPLHWAAKFGYARVYDYLVRQPGVDLNAKDNVGMTANRLAIPRERQ